MIEKARIYNEHIKSFKLPSLTQFDDIRVYDYPNSSNEESSTKFLFCGNAGYSEVIWTIIYAYEKICLLRPNEEVELTLILHGDISILQKFYDYALESKYSIKLLTHLTELDLFLQYAQASVLLAPLRQTDQDEARFPQKIAEYVATSKPIITTNIGDVALYFDSNESAIFINDFSINLLNTFYILNIF